MTNGRSNSINNHGIIGVPNATTWITNSCRNTTPQQQEMDGIVIPIFLRDLFGVDFVPSPHSRCCIEDDNNHDKNNDENESTRIGKSEEREMDVEETLVHQSLVVDTLTSLENHQTPQKSNKTPRKLSSFMKTIRRQRSADRTKENGKNRIKILSSLNQEESTPKRKGCSPFSVSQQTIPRQDEFLRVLQKQRDDLLRHQNSLASLQQISSQVQERAREITLHMSDLEQEAARLQKLLEQCIGRYENEKENLYKVTETLAQLDMQATDATRAMETSIRSIQNTMTIIASNHKNPIHANISNKENMQTPLSIKQLMTAGNSCLDDSVQSLHPRPSSSIWSKTPCSNAFVRVNDFKQQQNQELSSLSSHSSSWNSISPLNKELSIEDISYLDQNISWILDQLFELGYGMVVDESSGHFQPTRETARILKQESCSTRLDQHTSSNDGSALRPWHTPRGTQVLTWIGKVDHDGFGHDWPVVKARGIVRTSPRTLLEFLMDSSQVQKYVKFSQGREDVLILQDGVDITRNESEFGFPGAAKIVRSLLKPRMLPKCIEVLSLWHARPLKPLVYNDAYIILSRSVWEDDTGLFPDPLSTTCTSPDRIRSEMLLGVQLLLPCSEGCELTTLTHVYSPGVPEMMAKNAAPGNATNWIRDVQAQFS